MYKEIYFSNISWYDNFEHNVAVTDEVFNFDNSRSLSGISFLQKRHSQWAIGYSIRECIEVYFP